MALSRAKLGLYILGRREVFEACYELREAFELLLKRPDKLTLVTGELWPSERILADEEGKENVEGETVMEGVEHLGQYVFEMTKTRVEELKRARGLIAEVPVGGPGGEEVGGDVEDMVEGEGVKGGEQEEVDDDEEEGGVRVEGFEAEEE